MAVQHNKVVPLALASLLVLSIALVWLAFPQPVSAAGSCTPPDQKVTYGCCSCNVLKAIYWHCTSSGNWQQSGSACLWGQCCAYPCCN